MFVLASSFFIFHVFFPRHAFLFFFSDDAQPMNRSQRRAAEHEAKRKKCAIMGYIRRNKMVSTAVADSGQNADAIAAQVSKLMNVDQMGQMASAYASPPTSIAATPTLDYIV